MPGDKLRTKTQKSTVHFARGENSQMMPSEKGLKAGKEQWIKTVWVAGLAIWCATVVLLLKRIPEAQSFAQASSNSMRLTFVALFGTFW